MNILYNKMKNIYIKSRLNGWFFAILVLLTNFKFKIPTSASQGMVAVSFSELFIIIGITILLFKILKKQYTLTGISKNLFFLFIIICGIFAGIAIFHVIINNKSIFEFFGVVRNIFGCVIIWFLVDSKFIKKDEIMNGLINTSVLYSLSLMTAVIKMYFYDYPWLPSNLPDALYICTSLIPFCLFYNSKDNIGVSNFIKTLFIVSVSFVYANISGSRTAAFMSGVLFVIVSISFWKKIGLKVLKIQGLTLALAVGIFSILFMSSNYSDNIKVAFFRANPVFYQATNSLFEVDMFDKVEDLRDAPWGLGQINTPVDDNIDSMLSANVDEEPAVPNVNVNEEPNASSVNVDEEPAVPNVNVNEEPVKPSTGISTSGNDELAEIMLVGAGSGARSTEHRTGIWKIYTEEILHSPIIGVGERMVVAPDSGGIVTVLSTPHNFILEIAILFGLTGVLFYFILMGFVYFKLIFNKGLFLHEKITLLLVSIGIYGFAFVQPAITGGIGCNIILWSILSYMFYTQKERSEKKEKYSYST